ncbi:MAG TPA: UvrD-helicase domain-containing protein [Acidobacteriota bacterium]|nr:UvrD-helicase domain-containing protein [Acidobacteriota bacterium]
MTQDQEVRDRVTRDFSTSFCVEAGAGTGKTALMVKRVVEQVLAHMPISSIVAITFTEKAAGELKQRIREALEKKRIEAPEVFELLTEALGELDAAQISTIHGFAASILRERPVESRVDPNFIQLDELGATLLVDQEWISWLDKILASHNDTLKMALAAGLELEKIKDLFLALYRQRQHSNGLPRSAYSAAQASAEVAQIVTRARSYLQHCRSAEDTGFEHWSAACESFSDATAGHPPLLIKFLRELKVTRKSGNKANWRPGFCEKLKEEADLLLKTRDRLFTSILVDLLQLLKDAIESVEQEKNRRNVLDFDDLLLKARDLLLKDKATRGYFHEQYRSVIVDEFQDTDPLQVEIVFFLCEQEAEADRWQDVKLRPGKLCVVGDPKQSIYRFRRADIEIYMEARENITRQGEIQRIQENFRSAKELVDWINHIFGQMIQREENFQPEYQELLTSAAPAETGAPPIMILCNTVLPEKIDMSREMEAKALVSVIRRIQGERWQVRDPMTQQLRNACWRDIAILFQTLTSSHLYEAALRAADIPYRLEGGKQFFTRQEIHALVACLKAIDDPADQIALVAALRSLFFGFSDEDLLRLRNATGTLSYFKALDSTTKGAGEEIPSLPASGGDSPGGVRSPAGGVAARTSTDAEINRALALLRSLHEQRNRASFAFTLERLYRETHALEKHLLTRFGRQAVSNLKKAVARSRAFEQAGPTTFRRFVQWLHHLEEDTRQEPESTLVETDDDAVELLSIHRSKGLEFPIVILANIIGAGSDDCTAIFNNATESLEFHIKGTGPTFETPDFRAAKEAEERRQEAEKKRLLYVAATRARDHLLISAYSPKKLQGLLKHLAPVLPEIPLGIAPGEELTAQGIRLWSVSAPDLPPDPEISTNIEVVPEGERTWEDELTEWRDDRSAAFRRAAISWSPATASAAKDAAATETSFAAPRLSRMAEASALGSAFHRVMYRIPEEFLLRGGGESSGADNFKLSPLIEQTALEYGLADGKELHKLVSRPVPPALGGLFHRARQIYREVPFLLNLPEEFAVTDKKFPRMYEGVIDLIVQQEDGSLSIIDYKTDQVSAAQVPERMEQYRQQARIYRAAAARGTSQPVLDVYFYFVWPAAVFSEKHGLLKRE